MLEDYDRKLEEKWEQTWEETGIHRYDENSNAPVYSIDSPPPFTSGDLHMGHVLSYAYFDFVARYKRLRGFNVYYPQGWDCQGFPTEVKVEAKFGRVKPEEFRKHCVEWTGQYIERMKKQMIRMGYSPDWRHEYRTMSPDYHKRVQHSLLKMFEKELVYRSEHPVFWCTRCKSAIAKAETNDLERETVLNYVVFKVENGNEKKDLLVATTRPELLHACVAVFVHPEDDRYKELVGCDVETPLGAKVKLMAEADVDKEFGTGVVMVCTFGDKMDAVWAYRHSLRVIKSLDENGRLINAGKYDGLKADEAKKKIIEDLEAEGKVAKKEKLQQIVKVHDRCGKPIELIMSMQWFAKLKGHEEEIIGAAKKMKWAPEFTIQYLIDWANYVEWDWVISRQRVFGTPLPFWYCLKCGRTVAAKYEELPVNPPSMAEKKCECGEMLVAESSTCDCWVDSSITPLAIGKWPDNPEFFNKVYPSSLRPQGTEIIRTWAFYTIYRCLMLTGREPFKELLLNGNVLAPDGKKMSKSLGNIIPPDKLIEEYSADAVRQWAALSGALAKDRPFNYKDIQFAQSFIRKLWNASKFVQISLKDYKQDKNKKFELRAIDRWMLSRINKLLQATTNAFEAFDFHSAISGTHESFWHELCDNYLEAVKHRMYSPEKYGEESKLAAQYTLYTSLLAYLKMLAPFAPHVTEEIYQEIFRENEGAKSLHISGWMEADKALIDEESEKKGAFFNKVIGEVRKFKASNKMALNSELKKIEVKASGEQVASANEIIEELKAVGRIGETVFAEGEKEEFEVKIEK